MSEAPLIRVSAVVVYRPDGQVLTVRKAGTGMFMFPGGKPEPGESAVQAAVRELAEEIGMQVREDELRPLGAWRTRAANEAGARLHAEVFALTRDVDAAGIPAPAAEIAALHWTDPAAPEAPGADGRIGADAIAPLLHEVLPAL